MKSQHTDILEFQEFVDKIRNGEAEAVLTPIYEHLMPDFVRWGTFRFRDCGAELPDVFQETILAIFFKASRPGWKTPENASLKTYFYAVAYKKLLKTYKRRLRFFLFDPFDPVHQAFLHDPDVAAFDWDFEEPLRVEVLIPFIHQLRASCIKLLLMRLIEKKSIDEIRKIMEYSTLNTASSSCSRCQAELIDLLKEKLDRETLIKYLKLIAQALNL